MSGLLSRMSPFGHLLVIFTYLIPVLLSFDPVTPALFLGLNLISVFALGRVSLYRFVKVMGPLLIFPAGLFVLNVLFTDTAGREAAVSVASVELNAYALRRASVIAVRALALISISIGYLLVTEPLDLVDALMQQVHLPPRLGFSIFVGWNAIPKLKDNLDRIRTVHRVRLRGKKRTFGDLVPTGVTLLAGAIRHAQRASVSMAVRGIEEASQRTYLHENTWHLRDSLYVAGNLVLAGSLFGFLIAARFFVFGLG